MARLDNMEAWQCLQEAPKYHSGVIIQGKPSVKLAPLPVALQPEKESQRSRKGCV